MPHSTDVFGDYGLYYDLLYADKDYAAEAGYVAELLERLGTRPKSILEFGCGTGRHALLLAEMGCDVTGIERSSEMVKLAEARSAEREAKSGQRRAGSEEREAVGRGSFRCLLGDSRNIELRQTFDAVISLFHVVSYQTTDRDLTTTFQNAGRHVRPGGLFLFDVWYGPAVLSQRPAVRVKRMEDEQVHLTRIAEPTLLPDQNCVRVDYTLFAQQLTDGRIERCAESHLMRYFSTPEIRMLAERYAFDVACTEEWLTGAKPSTDTWGVCYVLRKRGRVTGDEGRVAGDQIRDANDEPRVADEQGWREEP